MKSISVFGTLKVGRLRAAILHMAALRKIIHRINIFCILRIPAHLFNQDYNIINIILRPSASKGCASQAPPGNGSFSIIGYLE